MSMGSLTTERRTAGSAGKTRSWRWFCLGVMASALGYAAFGHGGRVPLDWNISLLIIGVGAVAYWALTPPSSVDPGMPILPGVLALLVPAYVAFQLVPLPVFLVKILSPERGRILEKLSPFMPSAAFASISIAPAATFAHLFRVIAYLLVFLLVREVATRSRGLWKAAVPLIVIAALEAATGLIQAAAGAPVVGTYRSRNHFAGLLEMVLPVAIGCAIALLRNRHYRDRAGAGRIGGASLILGSAALMLAALGVSQSKMGFIASLGGLCAMASAAAFASIGNRKRWWVPGLVGALFLLTLAYVPSEQMVGALGNSLSEKSGEGRLPIWINTLHLLVSYPLTGSGLGTYEVAFPRYQTAVVDYGFEFAHNDYLELAAELGVAGFAILAAFALFMLSRALRAGTRQFDRSTRAVAWGCTGAIAAIGLHSLTDFNMYIPANAMVLAWILGIVAAFPSAFALGDADRVLPARVRFRGVAIVLGFLLLVYAPAWILFEKKFKDDPLAEMRFCRFGVCDTDAWVASEAASHGGSIARIGVPELLRALQREPAASFRWCDLADAFLLSGQVEQARGSFSTALALAPHIPPVQFRAAVFYAGINDRKREFEQTAGILEKSTMYDEQIFRNYEQEKVPMAEILATGLSANPRAAQAWLRYQLRPGHSADAATVWEWALVRHYVDERLAHDYVTSLYREKRYETAAGVWAHYLGERRHGYLESTWLLNGDFESEPDGIPFDWRLESLGDDASVAVDPGVAHTGSRSLRIRFGGKKNLDYAGASQTAFVKPGRYRFAAFVRTNGITTSQGVRFRIFDPDAPSRLDIKTEQVAGTVDWKEIEQVVDVPPGVNLLTIQVVRQPSLRIDNQLSGTAWIDTVILSGMK